MIQIDNRLAGRPRYLLTKEPIPLMVVPDEVRKCVLFVGERTVEDTYTVGGTAFWVSRPSSVPDIGFTYLVTAKHNINAIQGRPIDKVCLRANLEDGSSRWYETDIEQWILHPDPAVDVAVMPVTIPEAFDHRAVPVAMIATEDVVAEQGIGVGDEVFMPGLFVKHYGHSRNIPIGRVGNIAAMTEELVDTGLGLTDAYLIEVRSFGGFSGSPVFAHLGIARIMDGQVKLIQGDRPALFLLGLMHGHWNTKEFGPDYINIGIGIVAPATRILEVFDMPVIKDLEAETEKEIAKNQKPSMDTAFESGGNETAPFTRDDFLNALGLVSHADQPQSDEETSET